MFSKFPQKLTSPFGLLGDDAKLAFRTQADGIRKLAECKNISETDSYWEQYVLLFDSPSDVFALVSPHDIRRALVEAPKNVATLIKVLSARLFTLISDHTFPSSSTATVASYASSFMTSGTGVGDRNKTKEALNCLRVLQRVLPVVFEGENNDFEQDVLWRREEAKEDGILSEGDGQAQFVIEDDEDEDDLESRRSPRPAASPEVKSAERKTLPSLAEKLLSSMIDLLFCCGFTLPSKIQVDHYKINYVIWERGVGSTVDPGPNHAHDANKVEVLRFLLILLSRQIYVSPSSLLTTPSPFTLSFVQQTPRRHVLTVLCSLLNTAMNSSQQPAGVGSVAGKLPYNHLVFKGENSRLALVGISFQVLCVLLDFQSGGARDVLANGAADPSTPTAKTNAFRYFLAKLHRTADLSFILDGIMGIMEQHMASINNLLPGSKKPVPHILETIVFFWKMIELNKKFRSYLLDSEKAPDMLAYLLCYCMEVKDKPQQHGLCRSLSYIVQTLSAERAFGEKLSSPVRLQLPSKWNSTGTLGDFMINSIYSIVATTSGSLNSLYPALIIALSNSAPYYKHLTVVSSNRLIQLFTAFSNPSFLLSEEGHPRLLFFMMEVFNGVILHHLDENPNLVYSILRSHKAFEDLGTFTLARGLREVKRIQKAKEEQAQEKLGTVKGKNASTERDDEEPHEEKARLLRTETRDALGLSTASEQEERLPRQSQTPPIGRLSLEGRGQSDEMPSGQPLMSPTTAELPMSLPGSDLDLSEKARGKMRERPRSTSLDTTSSLERIAAAGIGRNGFIPTQEWVTSWQQGLPLDPVLLTISELMPKVHDLQLSLNRTNTTPAVIDFLRSATLKHILPPAVPLVPRRFLWSDSSIVWLTSLIWGEIYVRGMTPLGIWNATNVRLFYVKHTQAQPRQISNAVSQVVGGLGGLLGRPNPESPSTRSRNLR